MQIQCKNMTVPKKRKLEKKKITKTEKEAAASLNFCYHLGVQQTLKRGRFLLSVKQLLRKRQTWSSVDSET